MTVNVSRQNAELFAAHGISADALAATVAHYRNEGMSDNDIQKKFDNRVINLQLLNAPNVKPGDEGFVQYNPNALVNPKKNPTLTQGEWFNQMDQMRERNIEITARREAKNEMFNQVVGLAKRRLSLLHGFTNAGTIGLVDLALSAMDATLGTDNVDFVNELKSEYPTTNLMGEVAGYITPGGAGSLATKGGLAAAKYITSAGASKIATKGGLALAEKIGEKKAMNAIGKWATKAALVGAAGEAVVLGQKTAERIAGTREWNDQMGALGEFGTGLAWNVGLQAAFGLGGKAAGAIGKIFDSTKRAVNVMGGPENIAKAQHAYQLSANGGATKEQARGVFLASLTEGMNTEQAERMSYMLTHDADFARIMENQLAGAGRVVTDTVVGLTKAEANKASHSILKSVWGSPQYQQTFGTTEVDLSKKGISQMLGIKSPKMIEARSEALERAEEKVMNNADLAEGMRAEFKSLTGELITNGSRDLEQAIRSVEPGTLKSFQTSGAMEEAMQAAQDQIIKAQAAAKEAGRKFTMADAQAIEIKAMQNGAQKHFRRIIAEGTDSVQDVDDIRAFFRRIDEPAIQQGLETPLGAFNEGVNKRILDKLDSGLYRVNQAYRAEKPLQKAWDYGNKISDFNTQEISEFLNNTTSGVQKAAKLAALKQGFYARYADAAMQGDREAVAAMQSMLRSKNSMGQFISPQEFNEVFEQAIRPKVVAANNIRKFINAASMYKPQKGNAEQVMQLGMYAVLRAPVAGATTISRILNSTMYGKAVSRKISAWMQNPNWKDFNRIVEQTKDFGEREALAKAIVQAVQQIPDLEENNYYTGE